MLYAGLDNGKKGGIAILDEKQEIFRLEPMPVVKGKSSVEYNLSAITKIFEDLPDDIMICIEKSFMLPRNGCKANYNIGWNMGAMEGILAAFGLSYEIVSPQVWQKEIFQGTSSSKDTKAASIMFCKRKWPKVNLKVGNSTKENDNLADSLNIALYCWRQNNKK